MVVRVFKYGSLVLAISGLILLLFVANRSQAPTVELGDLAGTMNWAYVRVEGLVSRQPTYDDTAQSLTFWVWDGTGEIMIAAYRGKAVNLLTGDHLPVMGDAIVVEGTLRVKEDFEYLVLNDPTSLEIHPGQPLQVDIADIDAGLRCQKVMVQGEIREKFVPYEGLSIVTLRDASGEIDVAIPWGSAAQIGDIPDLQAGQSVQVIGAVDEYRSAPQISLGRGSDLSLLEESLSVAPMRRAADLSASDIGDLVLLEAAVTEIEPFSAGLKAVLDDGSGSVVLLLWQDLYESLDQRASLVEGSLVRVQGKVNEYRGRLEIVPEVPSDVSVSVVPRDREVEPGLDSAGGGTAAPTSTSHATVLSTVVTVEEEPVTVSVPPTPQTTVTVGPASSSPAASPTPPATYTPMPTATPVPSVTTVPSRTPLPTVEVRSIGSISQGDVGTTISIGQATISELDYFSKGVMYTLTDATGSITLLLWQNVIEEIPTRYDLVPGSQVAVVGEINDYQGDLEIIPEQGSGVVVLIPGDRLPIEERTAADVTPADERRIFSVEGVVVRTESNGWLKLWLGDGTGNVLVFVPQRTVPYLPLGIGVGVRLRVTGEVDIYQGVVEIIPLAGADVEVR